MAILSLSVGVVAYLLGYKWAGADFREINERNASANPIGLNHNVLVAWRFSVMCMGLFLCWCALRWLGGSMWHLLPIAGIAWSVFGSVHVYRLNRLRGLDWRYMSASSAWDRMWLGYAWWLASKQMVSDAKEFHADLYRNKLYDAQTGYTAKVHKAGTRAMLFRDAILLASIAALILLK